MIGARLPPGRAQRAHAGRLHAPGQRARLADLEPAVAAAADLGPGRLARAELVRERERADVADLAARRVQRVADGRAKAQVRIRGARVGGPHVVERLADVLHGAGVQLARHPGRPVVGHRGRQRARAVVVAEEVEAAARVGALVGASRLAVAAGADLELDLQIVRVVVRFDQHGAAGERGRVLRRVALVDAEVGQQAGREQIERDRLPVRLDRRQRRAIEQRGDVAVAEAADEHVAPFLDGDRHHPPGRVGRRRVGRARHLLRAQAVGHRRRALADLQQARLGAALRLRLDDDLLDRVGGGRQPHVDNARARRHHHVADAADLVERVVDAQLVPARGQREPVAACPVGAGLARAAAHHLHVHAGQRGAGVGIDDGAGHAGEPGRQLGRDRRHLLDVACSRVGRIGRVGRGSVVRVRQHPVDGRLLGAQRQVAAPLRRRVGGSQHRQREDHQSHHPSVAHREVSRWLLPFGLATIP